MRFISHIKKYGVGILQRDVEILPGNREREIIPGYTAQFKRGDVLSEEVDMAERIWRRVPGRTYEEDEVTPTSILARLSSYDTQAPENVREYERIDRIMVDGGHTLEDGTPWAKGTMKALVESKLLLKAANALDFFYAERPAISPPWPNYDSFPGTSDELVELLIDMGFNLNQALAYEAENQNRPEVVERLEQLVEAQAEAVGATVEEYVHG